MTTLAFVLALVTFTAFADSDSCLALLEELSIDPVNREGSVRRLTLTGHTKEGKECAIRIMPDFCSFQLEAPLESPEMYYLMDTSISSVQIKFRRGKKFSLRTVTKEAKGPGFGLLTRILDLEKLDTGYGFNYKVKDGRFIKKDLRSFSCVVTPEKKS